MSDLTKDEVNKLVEACDRTPYEEVLFQLYELHAKKRADYSQSDNAYSNFEASARYAGISVEQAFDNLIGTKIARLRNLKESGKLPNNESIDDTEFDLANYILIKRSYRLYKRRQDAVKGIVDPNMREAVNAIDRGFALPPTFPSPSQSNTPTDFGGKKYDER